LVTKVPSLRFKPTIRPEISDLISVSSKGSKLPGTSILLERGCGVTRYPSTERGPVFFDAFAGPASFFSSLQDTPMIISEKNSSTVLNRKSYYGRVALRSGNQAIRFKSSCRWEATLRAFRYYPSRKHSLCFKYVYCLCYIHSAQTKSLRLWNYNCYSRFKFR